MEDVRRVFIHPPGPSGAAQKQVGGRGVHRQQRGVVLQGLSIQGRGGAKGRPKGAANVAGGPQRRLSRDEYMRMYTYQVEHECQELSRREMSTARGTVKGIYIYGMYRYICTVRYYISSLFSGLYNDLGLMQSRASMC